jgi:hypothetical protein
MTIIKKLAETLKLKINSHKKMIHQTWQKQEKVAMLNCKMVSFFSQMLLILAFVNNKKKKASNKILTELHPGEKCSQT